MALRMTFGGSTNPAQWSDVSEVVTDLANDLVRWNGWDPQQFKSPHQALLLTDEAVDNDRGEIRPDDAFAEPEFFAVDEPEDDMARFDCYLDDIFGAFMDREAERSAAAIPLALPIEGRPHDPNRRESFPRDDILAIPKFLAEAKPSERKVILGWIVDTRKLSVALPQDKFKMWTKSVEDILRRHKSPIPEKELETLMGRLSHASYGIPYARHLTGRLYKACERTRRNGSARLTRMQLEDLELWRKFLRKAADGISINKLVCRWPTRIVRVDACPQGMGGYCLESGIAWRYLLPESLLGRATLNSLEFLAAFVGLLVEHGAGRKWSNADVMLSQGDSRLVAGLLVKSTFDNNCPIHLALARQFADFCITNDIVLYTQWFPGKKNDVVDVLSRNFALNDEQTHLQRLLTICTSALRDHPLAANDHFASWRLAASAAQNSALAGSTCAKRDNSWRRYECFLGRIGLHLEPFLGRFGRTQKIEVFASFAAALWGERLGAGQCEGSRHGRKSGTICTTLDGVAQTFRLHKFESPIHDAAG
jgi:hypothetical protein